MKKRKDIRLKECDYSSKGMYFVTICVKDMRHLFGKLVDNKMKLKSECTFYMRLKNIWQRGY